MTDSEARAIFDKAIAETSDPHKRDDAILLREYFTNAKFRRALEDHIWELTQAK